jgi:hypothetical protein
MKILIFNYKLVALYFKTEQVLMYYIHFVDSRRTDISHEACRTILVAPHVTASETLIII